jgi:hypothetical protein
MPLNTSKKPLIKYFQERMRAMMTRRKTIVMMEIVAARNLIKKSKSIIL